MKGPYTFALANPTKLDPHKFYDVAVAHASSIGGRVFPTQIFYGQFDRNGLIDTTSSRGTVQISFFSVDNAEKPEKYCHITVTAENGVGQIVLGRTSDRTCDRPRTVRKPQCRPVELLRVAATAEPNDTDDTALSEFDLANANKLGGGWQVSAASSADKTKKFSAYVKDTDCP